MLAWCQISLTLAKLNDILAYCQDVGCLKLYRFIVKTPPTNDVVNVALACKSSSSLSSLPTNIVSSGISFSSIVENSISDSPDIVTVIKGGGA